ncbi:MAG TPA: ABC transporter permease [Bryobacteraceae bacterium]|nr:ABC transporter permease [Bryobacteraceae bacterium]
MTLHEMWRRLLYLGRRDRLHSELNDEMQFHIESRADELQHGGISRAEALSQAHREFGSSARIAEDANDAWRFRWLDDLISDVRYSARALRRNPGFAVAAVFCLALGIGANTTIFNITTSFLFSLPSGRDASSLISILAGGSSASPLSDYKFLRDAHIFEGVGGINPEREVNWSEGGRTSRLYAGLVTDDYFTTLGIPCLLGRGVAQSETDTAVLSYRLWRTRFGEDHSILGRRLMLDGKTYTVVGVLPADHRSIVGFGFSPDIYVPAFRDDDMVQFYARMPSGMTVPMARARLQRIFQELDHIHPKDGGWKRTQGIRVTGVTGAAVLGMEQVGTMVAFFGLVLAVAGLLLLIACTNVASLLLARASSRAGELAVRLSLGASRARIVRHLLAESLVLSALGAVAGFLITVACGRLLSNLTLPLPVPIQVVARPDGRLLLYASLMVILSTLIAGLMPAFKAVRTDVNTVLKREQGRTGGVWGLRGAMVTGQLAVSVVLLATGFLFIHNLVRATSMNPGFDIDHTIWTYMRVVPERYTDPVRQRLVIDGALRRLRSLPGVSAAAITKVVPLNTDTHIGTDVRTDLTSQTMHINAEWNAVGPDYFRAIGIPLLRGREFSPADEKGTETAAIINETFARQVFGESNPVGHAMMFGPTKFRVIGVAKDSKYFTLGETQRLALYNPYFAPDTRFYFGPNFQVNLHFIIRTSGSPAGSVKPIQDALRQLDSSAAIETKPMIQSLGLALLPSQAGAALLGAMGMLGLILAAIGLYGGLLYTVSRRTREIGIRVALGATPGSVLRVVCQHSLTLVGTGLLIGLALATLATRPLAMFLVPGLSSSDPISFVAVSAVFGAVALLATLTPAFRALRVDPMTALRYE